MDNITHSLIGAAVGKNLPVGDPTDPASKRATKAAFWACVIGNNLPDLDVIIRFLPKADHLDYLVQHRGYSHTVLFGLPLAYFGAWIAAKANGIKKPTRALFIITYLSILLHIAADYMNNYGVHPFMPFSSTWIYGDAVSIVEPLLWLGLIPYLFRDAETKYARGFLALLACGMLVVLWTNGMVSKPAAVFATVWGIAHALIAWCKWPFGFARRRLMLVVLACVPAAFFVRTAIVKHKLATEFAREFSSETMTDMDLMASPANPFCAKLWVASKTETEFRFRSFWHDPFGWCPDIATKQPTARAETFTVGAGFSPSFRPEKISVLPKALFERDLSESCEFRYLMSFVRFPFIRENLTTNVTTAGDLRYDRGAGIGFSEIAMRKGEACTHGDPPWVSPFKR